MYSEYDQIGRSPKAQFKYADKIGARYVLAIGENELQTGTANLRRLCDGTEFPVSLEAASVMSHIGKED